MTDTIGQQLRQARQEKRLSLEEAALTTHIRLRYLQALEADDFSVLPSDVHLRGFLRSYAQLLDLPFRPLLAQLQGLPVDDPPPPEQVEPEDQPESDPTQGQSVPDSSQVIFRNLGDRLKQQRYVLGLSLEEVENQTHIRLHYLHALEQGRLEELPSPVQGRGMLSGYAVFMGMEPEPLLMLYADGLQERLEVRRQQLRDSDVSGKKTRRPLTVPNPLRRLFSSGLLTAGFLVVFLVGFVFWAGLRVSQMQTGQQPSPTSPSIAEVLAPDTATPTETPLTDVLTLTPEELDLESTSVPAALQVESTPTLEPTATLPSVASGKVQLYLVARQRAWVRVIVDGAVALDGRLVPGSAYLFDGDERVELLTGNGAALQVFLNREDLGPLGIYGQVVQRVFTVSGMQTPTPLVTSTPIPSSTATVTQTGEATPTGTPSPTPDGQENAP